MVWVDNHGGHEMAIETSDKFRDFSHGGNVDGNVERIGHQQQQDDPLQDNRREI